VACSEAYVFAFPFWIRTWPCTAATVHTCDYMAYATWLGTEIVQVHSSSISLD